MKLITSLLFVISLSIFSVSAQTTAFSYQGSLKDGANAATGSYDFEFRLFDALSAGNQVGSAVTRNAVAVESGTFSVSLDFGAPAFSGADRWIEVWVRPAGGGGFQQLLPRTRLASTPYAIQSLNAATAATATNATQLAGVAGNQYVVTTDPRMTNARTPTAGSASYIQNQNAGAQVTSNFNISGNGTAGGTLSADIVNATTQLNIAATRAFTINGALATPGFSFALSNTFAGVGAGVNTVPDNSSIGASPGKRNAFFGVYAGLANTSGYSNSFYGASSGESNTTGILNAFYGHRSGESNTFGGSNSFFGVQAGGQTTSGENNTFIGRNAGTSNFTGSNNTALGHLSVVSGNLQYATAIGAESEATLSNSIYLGRPGGEDTVRVPGNLNLTGNATLNGNFTLGSGGIAVFNSSVSVTSLAIGGATSLCRNASNLISTCSSSLRYKNNIARFGYGLDLIRNLKPITFDWKEGGMHDLGLGAEDVAAIEPLLVTYNAKGEVEGVKYDRIGVVLINAVKEQQAVIESQKKRLDEQSDRIDALTRLLCKTATTAEICK